MTLDQYLRQELGTMSEGWFDLGAKVRLENGRLIVLDLEVGAADKPPSGVPSARAFKGGTEVIWRHKVEL